MKSADVEIAVKITDKLQETKEFTEEIIEKVSTCIKDGSVSAADIVFTLENPRNETGDKK